jgi:hypothetical protein
MDCKRALFCHFKFIIGFMSSTGDPDIADADTSKNPIREMNPRLGC